MFIWLVPTILWICTLSGNKYVKYLFVNWFKWFYGPQWGAFACTAVWFMNAVKNRDEEVVMDPNTPVHQLVITCVLFYAVSIANIVIVLVCMDSLAKWHPKSWSQTNESD